MTASIVVVTRNANLSLGLTHHGYDVAEVRPDRHGDWTHHARVADAVVLELSDAVAAESAVLRLRSEGLGLPVLVVSNATPGWDTTAAHVGPGALVLPLPISLPKLTSALDALIAEGPVEIAPPPQNEEELLSAVAASVGLSITETGTVVQGSPSARAPAAAEPEEEVAEEAAEPEEEVAEEAEPAAAEPDEEPEPPEESEPVAKPAPKPPKAVAPAREAPAPERPLTDRLARAATARPPTPAPRAAESHVAVMLEWAHDLTGVAECAEVVVAELAERIGADAAALLLPDGAEWRVAGGTGLRPLEYRVRLADDHWLIKNVVLTGDGLLAEDSDAARDELIGAPLASWTRVLAAPVLEVRGLFLAARSAEPFGPDSLARAFAVGTEAAPLLVDALAVRELARALTPYTELDDD